MVIRGLEAKCYYVGLMCSYRFIIIFLFLLCVFFTNLRYHSHNYVLTAFYCKTFKSQYFKSKLISLAVLISLYYSSFESFYYLHLGRAVSQSKVCVLIWLQNTIIYSIIFFFVFLIIITYYKLLKTVGYVIFKFLFLFLIYLFLHMV